LRLWYAAFANDFGPTFSLWSFPYWSVYRTHQIPDPFGLSKIPLAIFDPPF
jgi:hypothetical protein